LQVEKTRSQVVKISKLTWKQKIPAKSLFNQEFRTRQNKSKLKITVLTWDQVNSSHHAEGLVDPNRLNKKTVTDLVCPRACGFRKYQFENRSWEGFLPTFFKNWFLLHKLLLKLEKVTKNSNFWIFFLKSHFWI
jgi:hypothetical protein